MATRAPVVEFGFDISCPFAYIATTRIEDLATRCYAEIVWKPVLLGAIYEMTKAPQGKAGSASDTFNPTKKALTERQMKTTLKRHKVPLNWPKSHPQKTTAALRLIYYAPNIYRPALAKALFKAYWVDNKDVTDIKFLISLAKSLNIPNASDLSETVLSDSSLQDLLRAATSEAVDRRAPGVPFFYIAKEKRGWWGQDRMQFVEAALTSIGRNIPYGQVPSLAGLMPRCLRETPVDGEITTRLEFWFDFSSPWSYIGYSQLERIQKEAGSSLEIVLKPMLLGALFMIITAPKIPLFTISKQKRRYGMQDQQDWINYWNAVTSQLQVGKQIRYQFPTEFPIRSPLALRCFIVEPKVMETLYLASWADNVPISSPEVLADTLTKAGFDAEKIISEANKQEIKDQLRSNTDEAKNLGLCGAPGYRVLKKINNEWTVSGNMIWGQDNINVVQDLIAGWNEDTGKEVAQVSTAHLLRGMTKGRALSSMI